MSEIPLFPWWLTLSFAAWAAIGPLIGLLVGHMLTRSWQRQQWLMDNKKQEYRELLSAISHTIVALINSQAFDNNNPNALKVELMNLSKDVYRIFGDRIFIADDMARTQLRERWMGAINEFLRNCNVETFALRVYEIKETLVKLAVESKN
ncbi:MAG: hypothetical protein ACHP8B_06495 [Terriglobales bacterium]